MILTASHREIEEQIRRGEFAAARFALGDLPEDDPIAALLRLDLELEAGSSPAAAVQQRLIQLMRQKPDLPRIKELYQTATRKAYEQQSSSAAHSHPPPSKK